MKRMNSFIFEAFVALFCLLEVSGAWAKPTVCLNMIVRDEHRVVRRCLESVKPMIDRWVIVDTGSTDNTQEIIKECMGDIPGELFERPWVSFEHNRNEALELAKGKADYLFFIDADEMLLFAPNFSRENLDKDFYSVVTELHGTRYGRIQLISNRLDWKWEGVLHETLICSGEPEGDFLGGVLNFERKEGYRSHDRDKFKKDVQVLEAALLKEPENQRYQFYLAQSYRDAREYEKAIDHYERRIAMGGWDQEVFWSMYQVGVLQERLGKESEEIEKNYLRAFHYRTTRAEPLYQLARYHRKKKNYSEGYEVAKQGLEIPFSDDALFVESCGYEYGLLLEYSICAYYMERYEEAYHASQTLLSNDGPKDLFL